MRKINIVVLFICSILFFLPFLWLSPGELELGGDSNRLFLYEPGSYLQVNALYSVEPLGVGKVASNQNMLPFLAVLHLFDSIFHSPYLLMTLLNSLKLVGAFIFLYLIIVEMLAHESGKAKSLHVPLAGILAGIFYVLSPSVGENFRSALLTHNQVFLNPMVVYLLLRFFVTNNSRYLWVTILVTVIFSPNFSLIAPPPPFAFYPITLVFLSLYTVFCLKKPLPWRKLLVFLICLFGLHAFQIIPAIGHIFDPSSDYYTRALDATSGRNEALDYFDSTRGLGSVSKSLFLTYAKGDNRWTAIVGPLVIILGFLLSKKISKALLFISLFFGLTLFLISANITQFGVELYRLLFYIPGFSMFRVFYGQWQWVYAFFYALLVGFCGYVLLARLKPRIMYIFIGIFIILLVINSWSFVSGSILRAIHPGSKGMTSIVKLNPDYEDALSFIRSLPDDSKIFNLPFNDFFYQVVPGANNGAYIGPSFTSYITGKRTFSGYQIMYPFPEVFLKLIKEKNYAAIKRLFGLLNVKYISYIKDPKAFVEYYPTWPYSLFARAIPDQKSLSDFVDILTSKVVFEKGDYSIRVVGDNTFLPHFYVPTTLKFYDNKGDWYGKNSSFFVDDPGRDPRVGYIDDALCEKDYLVNLCDSMEGLQKTVPKISFQKVNPTRYSIQVKSAPGPFVLIFSDQFHNNWKLFASNIPSGVRKIQESYFQGDIEENKHEETFWSAQILETLGRKAIAEDKHFMINGYANAWYIRPEDFGGGKDFEIILEMSEQRLFYYGIGISIVSLPIFIGVGIILFSKKSLIKR